jgi:Mce-associated membrane protein
MTDDAVTEPVVPDAEEVHAEEPPAHEPATPPARRRWPAVAAAALVLVALVGAVGWGAQQRSDAASARETLDRQRDGVLVASGFVEALLSYDHRELDTQQAAVERFATERFRTEYTEAFTAEVRDQIVAEQATSTVVVEGTWLTVDDGDEASAVVHAVSTVSSVAGASADLESYLRVRLVRLDDEWLVDDLTSLGSRDLGAPLPTPTAPGEEGGAGG